ncbi:MAG: tetratricopeptide repeat protein [Planctomycetes bacterium]|nr:tetratricopeptide repeat protein [Planctomycetota bacterium]
MRLALSCLTLFGLAFASLPSPAAAQHQSPPQSLREQAFGAENRGDFATAAEAFLKLVAAEPGNPKWVVNAGSCLGRSGRFADAIDLLEEARKKFDGVIEVPSMLARTLLLKAERDAGALDPYGLRTQAAELAEGVLRLDPDHEDSRLVLAQARYMMGDWDEAVKQAEEAVRRHPDRSGAHILLGRIAADRMRDLLAAHDSGEVSGQALADLTARLDGQRKSAQASFERAAELDPTRAHPHVMLARIALLDKKAADVRRHLLDALAIDPETSIDHRHITDGLDWQGRQQAYATALQRYSEREGATARGRGTLRWFVGKALFDGRQWQAARAAFEQALVDNPAAFNSYYYAALAAYELGDHDGAEKHAGDYAAVSATGFADVVRNLAGDARGQVAAIVKFLADRAYANGNKARSRELNHVTALLYDTAEAWNNRAFLCRETGRFEDAVEAYGRALLKEPKSPQLLNDLAVVLHYHLPNEANLRRARGLYEQAIENARAILDDANATASDRQLARQALTDATSNLAEMK